MKTNKLISVEVISIDKPTPSTRLAPGWGDQAVATHIDGGVVGVAVKLRGEFAVEFRILETGRIIITHHTPGGYDMAVSQNLSLNPKRNWK